MQIVGKQFIRGERVASSAKTFVSYDAAEGVSLPYTFYQATGEEVRAATKTAAEASSGASPHGSP